MGELCHGDADEHLWPKDEGRIEEREGHFEEFEGDEQNENADREAEWGIYTETVSSEGVRAIAAIPKTFKIRNALLIR